MPHPLAPSFLGLLLVLVACGGKIAPDGEPRRAAAASEPSSDGPEGAATPPAKGDACASVCDRNAVCGAWTIDCVDTCVAATASARCGEIATLFYTCWARTSGGPCAALSPECEPAYCALGRCESTSALAYCDE